MNAKSLCGTFVAGLGGVLAGASLNMSPSRQSTPVPESIDARSFRLLDAAGRVRGLMSVLEDDSARVELRDAAGKKRLEMAVGKGADVYLWHADGKLALDLCEKPDSTTIAMCDRDGAPCLFQHVGPSLITPKAEAAKFMVLGRNGDPIVSLSRDEDDRGWMWLGLDPRQPQWEQRTAKPSAHK